MSRRSHFLASMHNGIVKGSCIVLQGSEIVYAGPIEGAPLNPPAEGKLVLLHADDFQSLRAHVESDPLPNNPSGHA
jgi:hypothetical protein